MGIPSALAPDASTSATQADAWTLAENNALASATQFDNTARTARQQAGLLAGRPDMQNATKRLNAEAAAAEETAETRRGLARGYAALRSLQVRERTGAGNSWGERFQQLAPPAPEPQPDWPPIPESPHFHDVAGVFEFGYCHALALALHELVGWRIVHMSRDRGAGSHYLVRRDDGLLVDVRGARTDDQVSGQWDQDGPRSVFTDSTPDEVIRLVVQGDLPDPATVWDLAQRVAGSLAGDQPRATGGWIYQQPRITGGYDYDVTFPGNPHCDQRIFGLDNLLDFLARWRRDGYMHTGMARVIDLNTDLEWDGAALLDHHTSAEPAAVRDPAPQDVQTAVAVAQNTFRLNATAAGTIVDLLVDHDHVVDGSAQAWVLDQIREQLHNAGDYYTKPSLVSHHLILVLQGSGT